MDEVSRVCVGLKAGTTCAGQRLAYELECMIFKHGRPEEIRVDNGPEFLSEAFVTWTRTHDIKLLYTRPGKPTDHRYIESFNGRLRDENLETIQARNIAEANTELERWEEEYNGRSCPHSRILELAPRTG